MPLEHHYLVGGTGCNPMHVEQNVGCWSANPYVVGAGPRGRSASGRRAAARRGAAADARAARRSCRDAKMSSTPSGAPGDAPRDLFRFQPRGVRQEPCDGCRESGVRLTSREEATTIRRSPRRGRRGSTTRTPRARVPDVPRGRDGRDRRAPRRELPASRRRSRSFRGGIHQGGVRDRDAVARHQHAGQDGRDRGPLEVPGGAPRARDPGGVHAAHRVARDGVGSMRSGTPSSSTSGRCRSSASPGSPRTRTYDLTSSFRPSYNMAVNLVRNYTPEQAHHMLNSSFAQFLADRGVVALERAKRRDREALDGYRQNIECHSGDFDAYWALFREAERLRAEDRRGIGVGPAADEVRAAATATQARRCDRPADGSKTGGTLAVVLDDPGGPTDGPHGRSLVLPARARTISTNPRRHSLRSSSRGPDRAGAPAIGATSPRR